MTTPVAPGTVLGEAVEQLLARLREHDTEAASIRATLAELRRKIAAAGKRAGPKARSGRKRRGASEPREFTNGASDDRIDVPAN